MTAAKLLLVEDDEVMRKTLTRWLQGEGYDLIACASGEEAISQNNSHRPKLILLDVGLPDRSGYEVCQSLRASPKNDETTIVMLSGKGSESEIVRGLELGADDYIVKPCTSSMLSARLRSVLRRVPKNRQEENAQEIISIHGLRIDPKRHRVFFGESEIVLTTSEFKILYFLAARPGWVFTRTQITMAVKGQEFAIGNRSSDVQVFSLRKHLGELQWIIETVRSVGYRMKEG